MNQPSQPPRRERDRAVRRVLWIVLGMNAIVAATKLGLGAMAGSLSLLADGLHAVLDASSNVVGLVGMAYASAPPDADHPYGHRRFETIAALVIGLLIAAGMVQIGLGVVASLQGTRQQPVVTAITAVGVAITIAMNFLISRYEAARGRTLRSALLDADAAHTMSDALGAITVLVSFAFLHFGIRAADPIAAVVVCILIGRTAYDVLSKNLGVLTDRARLDPHGVRDAALAVQGVLGAHKIRSRGAADAVQVDLHIHVDPAMTVEQAHALTHQVVDAIRGAFPEVVDVVIHTEPADGRELDKSTVAPA